MQLPDRSKENLWNEIESKPKNGNGVSPPISDGRGGRTGSFITKEHSLQVYSPFWNFALQNTICTSYHSKYKAKLEYYQFALMVSHIHRVPSS